jgi:CheY-like chemotaxis protein
MRRDRTENSNRIYTEEYHRMALSGKTKRILVLDDEPDVVTYLEMLLRDNGYETVSASNGRSGMDIVRREKPDLVTLDISMPEGSGTVFYKQLKSDPDLTSIPVVIVTAITVQDGDPYGFKDVMCDRQQVPAPEGYHPKPIDKDEFVKIIHRILS